jgi:hypothetical protein
MPYIENTSYHYERLYDERVRMVSVGGCSDSFLDAVGQYARALAGTDDVFIMGTDVRDFVDELDEGEPGLATFLKSFEKNGEYPDMFFYD